ncbi:3-phosphoshikimate 1-carboxyvinyltransferase [Candidatus Poriferisodalis sp.]|uniref:3-phosphoshikimate 1-carboxyvinyltransferase n=1 Tax=Candidatus Poriferisodalis sp. TaxID=3101277 RepID=UPI003B02E2E6
MSAGRAIGVIDPFTNGASGTARLPGSKSITNRAVLCAALASGRSTLDGVLFADDTEAMIEAVTALGAVVRVNRGKRRLVVDGIGGRRSRSHDAADEPVMVHARSSGTTARFILPVMAALGGRWLLDGDPQLRTRPLDDLLAAQRSLGVEVHELGEHGCLPIEVISAGDVDAPLLRHVRIRADTSSQFATGLLLAGPLRGGIHVEIDAAFDTVSRPYIDMTVAVMEAFGANVVVPSADRFVVTEGGYRSTVYPIEPDASAASYVWATAALCGGEVRVEGLGSNSIQGDVRFAEVLGEMGAEVTVSDDAITVGAPPGGTLRGGSFDLRDFSDTAQTLAAVAAFAEGTTAIEGIGFIRRKETDRIANTAAELARRGIDAVAEPDGITIRPNPFGLRAGLVDCHGDHRMAMAMTLVGLRVAGIDIDDPDCVAKTFPDFFDALESLRASPDSLSGPTEPSGPVIAIDGPAASGKSSVARAVAAELGMDYLDTGAMYRAVAWAALQAGIDITDQAAVAKIARTAEIEISSANGAQRVTVDGDDATAAIRSAEVDRHVSVVAANPQVRWVLTRRQRDWANRVGGGVMEGRDIGSVVFPDAVLKVFLTAAAAERARRRLIQQAVAAGRADGANPDGEAVAELAAELSARDRLDSGRVDSPLRVAPGAVIVDTSELSQDEAVETITALYRLATEPQETVGPHRAGRR